ncbi:MAG TPA: DUF6352 family protein [Beijerinckiaceae bacterium]|nr:DUF6352 family protein [Beijerinckiaceae bacterium]
MSDDFWLASGHHLLDRDGNGGGLLLTDDFLKAYLARPELVPPAEACPVERGVHAELMASPRHRVATATLDAIADADARDNIRVFLTFRDHLLRHRTLEDAYVGLFRARLTGIPALFVQQLVAVVARNAFDRCADPFVLRAAECLFRPQKVTIHEGALLLADAEVIDSHEANRKHSPLLTMLGGPAVTELSVLNDSNAASYFHRSDAHDLVLNLFDPAHGRAALGEAARVFIRHLCGIDLVLEPVEQLDGEPQAWFLAFDAEATAIGNAVWRGEMLDPDWAARVLALYRFRLPDDRRIAEVRRGRPGFALAAMTSDRMLNIKPQNLILGLPLNERDG